MSHPPHGGLYKHRLPSLACRASCRRLAALAAAATLAACAPVKLPEPPAPPPPAVTEAPAPPRPPPPQRLSASWAFRDDGDRCTAAASSAGVVFRITATRAAVGFSTQMLPRLAAARGRAAVLRFQGTAGSWVIPAGGRGRTLDASSPLTEEAAGQVLVLLSGGVLQPGRAGIGWPSLALPSAGPAGKAWFDCVRRQLQG